MTHKPFVTTGRQRKYEFPNGFGASVINDGYGSDSGRYELGVLHEGNLTYETPITDDVLGWLSESEVEATLDRIAALTPEDLKAHRISKAEKRIEELRAEIAALEAEAQS